MRATVDIRATFDYTDEVEYAENLVQVMERVREVCSADVLGSARRDERDAHDGHIAPETERLAVAIADSRPRRRRRAEG